MAQLFINNFETTFIASVKDAPTTGTPATELDYGILRISDGAAGALINPGSGDYYVLTAFKRVGTVESDIEVMRVTSVDNSVPGECRITVLRAQEGTTAKSYVSGDRLALRLTAGATNNWVQGDDARLTNSRTPTGPAGGVLSGTYPNPGFAVDMATQAELDAHTGAASNAHAASAISNAPAGNISATTVQAAINELDTEKQAALVSGTNIRTVNGNSLLGSGNVAVGDVTGPASSVSGRVATFSGTTGKVIQDGGKLLPAGDLVGTTDSQTLTNKTLTDPKLLLGGTNGTAGQVPVSQGAGLPPVWGGVGNAATATKLQTARTITIGNTSKSFDGSANVSWSLAEIGVAASDQVSYVYDSQGRIASVDETLPSGTRTTTYTYNGSGQLTQAVSVLGGVTRTTTYTYDSNGSLTSYTVTES